MAIAFDAVGTGGSTAAPGTSITYAHTVTASPTQPGIIVSPYVGDNNGGAGSVSSVTYNGDALGLTTSINPGSGRLLYMYDRTACDTGTNNVVITFGNSLYGDGQSTSYTGVDQTDMIDNTTTNSATSNVTLTLTTVADNCWLVGSASNSAVGLPTAGTGTTSRGTQGNLRIGDSNGAKTPPGSFSMQYTAASGLTFGVMASIKPFIPTTAVKTAEGLAIASVKTGEGLAKASIKTWQRLA